MLRHLHIKNIAVIDDVSIDFSEGFNVLTGETGAGKSIIIDSINLVLGQRAAKEIIRAGAAKASVTAIFDNNPPELYQVMDNYGIEAEDEIIVQREITPEGKSVCRVNGQTVTAAVLKDVGRCCINIHGQHDNLALFNPAKHIDFLDSFGGYNEMLSLYTEVYIISREIKSQLDKTSMDEREKAYKIDMLTHQVEEIKAAFLKADEEDELIKQRDILQSSEKISTILDMSYDAIFGGSSSKSVTENISTVNRRLAEITRYDEKLEGIAARLEGAMLELEDIAYQMKEYSDKLEYEPSLLDSIESRLDVIFTLKRKYHMTVPRILDYYKDISKELHEIHMSDEKREILTLKLEESLKKQQAIAEKLTALRNQFGKALAEGICAELADLDMARCSFAVDVRAAELNTKGADEVEFMVTTNPGEPVKPLSKIASGGEMSRIMLAIKSILSDSDSVNTLIFDEIDTGVSGRAAQRIAEKIRSLSAKKQILCITHLAQIAALADNHILIQKNVVDDRTSTECITLDTDGRVREIARIIGGTVITDLTLASAKEMLTHAT